jgi:DNA-binding IscR family transcriptional regulator
MLKNLLKVSSEIPVEFEASAERANTKPTLVRKLLSKSAKAGLVGTTRGKHGCCDLSPSPTRLSGDI